jgi:hypothetical protein
MATELPADFDSNAFMDRLIYNVPGADDLDVPPPLAPGEKVTVRRTLTMNWDVDVDSRVRKIAQERGISVEDLIDEWAELEIARVDALEALNNSRHRGTAA